MRSTNERCLFEWIFVEGVRTGFYHLKRSRTMKRNRSEANIDDMARSARRHLPKVIWDYLDGGAEDEVTIRCNRNAFDRYRFRPRTVTGNGKRDLSISLWNMKLSAPFMIAPTGLNGIIRPDADLMLARAAAETGIAFALSTASNNSLEQIASAIAGPRFFQMYPWGGQKLSKRLIERAGEAGYDGLIVTVDSLIPGNRERDVRNRFEHALHLSPRILLDAATHPNWVITTWLKRGMPRFENIVEFVGSNASAYELAAFTRTQRNPFYSWDDIAWVRQNWRGPLLIKGILTSEDAKMALNRGVDGIVVSNHGGRALDGAPASLDVLPEIAEAAKGMVVLIDSGFRRGSDIVKALALGAHAVMLGRAPLYGLAAGGEAGVRHVLDTLRSEVDRVMGQIGCASISDIGSAHIDLARTSLNV